MTVAQLIEKLQKCDPNVTVVLSTRNQKDAACDVLAFDVAGNKYVMIQS